MKKYQIAAIIAAVAGFLVASPGQVKAQDSFSSLFKTTYFVEVQYRFYHWTSGSDTYWWETMFETESYSEAQTLYQVLSEALEDGNLDYLGSSGTTSVTYVVDVRIRTKTELRYEIIQNPNYRLPTYYSATKFQLK